MPRDRHFEEFKDHTLVKHFLLEVYLKPWARILAGNFRAPRLWYIDAFAGAGRDEKGRPGSPVIGAEVAHAINREFYHSPPAEREGMRVVTVEVDPARHERLAAVLGEYPDVALPPHLGTIQDILSDLLNTMGRDPRFFFLDPFGVGGLDAEVLGAILAGPTVEVLILFADEGAVRLAGKADSIVPSRDDLLSQRNRGPSILGADFDAEFEASDRAAVDRILAGHSSNPNAERILNQAFGGPRWREILNFPENERRGRFVDAYRDVLLSAGATHVLDFQVATEDGRHKYTLIHGSKNVRAFGVMKDAMDRAAKRATPPAEEISLFGEPERSGPGLYVTPTGDVKSVALQIAAHFSGKAIPWRAATVRDVSVYQYAVDETSLMMDGVRSLKDEFERLGYTMKNERGKPETPLKFNFP